MSGASPGPAPPLQARASNARLRRSSWRTWPQRKLRRKVPRVDGALTVQPSTLAVPPARNASASSMQSPPASAEATRVSSLSPAFAQPGASPRSRWASASSRRPSRPASVEGSSRPAWSTRRSSSKVMCIRSGLLIGSIEWVLPVAGTSIRTIHCPSYSGAPNRSPSRTLLRWIRDKRWTREGGPVTRTPTSTVPCPVSVWSSAPGCSESSGMTPNATTRQSPTGTTPVS